MVQALSGGDASAASCLMPLVYDELRSLAAGYLARESRQATIQPTMLVHEAYLKMVDQNRVVWADRRHFMAVAATQMRRILIDHARARRAVKRGGGLERVTLSGIADESGDVDLVELDEVLTRLAETDAGLYRIVELRFFTGMTMEEVAGVLSVSVPTVERHWRLARAWLTSALRGPAGPSG
ncbi:MAG: sigma-70 family RNA polymerase sigma factor [Phycisphaerae bacterium]|nr:MAG: RNA polymerase subunit sigma-70 [Planctomycetota bacterium]KAB2944457.1 MAG: RNA polymerase subunit sigma-70 [Phycisphaerae bacterium]MBE7457561.1 RNA polymerase subunit sigma-70 [Planctomycetia bacterium]MCK6464599.1 sigma-70 family RNA polymerase sigma factor [Phycisphaerae bacterium]MCL4717363.1 sigma-70 family RNA polymerase sigma factor [Phycisphaerae bacterium]